MLVLLDVIAKIGQLLLDRNDVDPNSTDLLGRTPLSHAADRGQKAIVELLLGRKDI